MSEAGGRGGAVEGGGEMGKLAPRADMGENTIADVLVTGRERIFHAGE